MYDERIENLIKAALADGELTEKEKQILFKNAEAQGIDLDEFEMILDAKLVELKKAEAAQTKQQELELAKAKAAVVAQPSAPKSNKVGDVKKCPACGAIVSGFQLKCSECGYEFLLTENEYVSSIAKKYSQAEEIEDKIKLIESIVVPTSTEELVEIMFFLQPLMADSSVCKEAAVKSKSILSKIKIVAQHKKDLLPYMNDFEKAIKDAETYTPTSVMICVVMMIAGVIICYLEWQLSWKGFWKILLMVYTGIPLMLYGPFFLKRKNGRRLIG